MVAGKYHIVITADSHNKALRNSKIHGRLLLALVWVDCYFGIVRQLHLGSEAPPSEELQRTYWR